MNKQKLRLALMTVSCVLFLLALFTLSAYHSFKKIIVSETQRIEANMAFISDLEVKNLQDTLSHLVTETSSVAGLVSIIGTDSSQLYRCLDSGIENGLSESALLFGSDGLLKYGTFNYRDAFASSAMKALAAGGPTVSEVFSVDGGASLFAVTVPFEDSSGTPAALSLIYPASVLASYPPNPQGGPFTLSLLKADGSPLIATEDGTSIWQLSETRGEPLLSALSYKFSGYVGTDGGEQLILSAPIGINDWYLVTSVPKSYIFDSAERGFLSNNGFVIISFVILASLVFSGILFLSSRQRKLSLERQRFNFATSQSNRAVFEYGLESDHLNFISNCKNISLPNDEKAVSLSSFVSLLKPEDRLDMDNAIRTLKEDGCTQVTLRMSGLRKTCDYHWYHITAEKLSGSTSVIGTIEDIDERETERIDLLKKAITDPLTGLFDRAETERLISEHLASLEEGRCGTFCIVDMDNFKLINDNNGHDCGDKALSFFAKRLRDTFRFGDIIGRLGGDEFVVYMSFTSNKEVVLRRFDELMNSLSRRTGEECKLPQLTCSIGCVIAQPGDDFSFVYTLADKALYRAKTSGKRRVEFEETA